MIELVAVRIRRIVEGKERREQGRGRIGREIHQLHNCFSFIDYNSYLHTHYNTHRHPTHLHIPILADTTSPTHNTNAPILTHPLQSTHPYLPTHHNMRPQTHTTIHERTHPIQHKHTHPLQHKHTHPPEQYTHTPTDTQTDRHTDQQTVRQTYRSLMHRWKRPP